MPIEVEIFLEGSRVKPWLYRPDGGVLERLEWLTDVMQSFDGSEQRVRVRGVPRRYFEFASTLSDRDRRAAENLLYSWQGKVWAIPVWMDAEPLSAGVSSGATSIPAVTATRDYYVGGLVGIMSDAYTYEIVEIDEVQANALVLAQALQSDWAAGTTLVFPMRAARMPEDMRLSRFTGATAYGRFRFQCVDDSDYTAATETTYLSYPVLTLKPNWTEDVDQEYLRKLQIIDARTGGIFVDDEAGGPILGQSHRWLLDGRTQIDDFRKWLYARKGRLTAFWLPSWAQDLLVVADIGMTAQTIDVEHCGYTLNVEQGIARRDIRIQLANGTVFYRRITGSAEVSGTVERLSIDSALGQLVDKDDIALVSFMALSRLEADAAEISWWRWDVAEARLNTRGMLNDI